MFGCKTTSQNMPDANSNCESSTIVDSDQFMNAPSDPFFFRKVIINGDCLEIELQYGGGCGDTEFQLVGAEEVMESFPEQRNIRLSFKDEDNCEALVTKTLSYDLTSTRVGDSGTVILRLQEWEEGLEYNY